jgi:hypothetical protein
MSMKLSKLKEKFVLCQGCRTLSTINFTINDITKEMICPTCGKHSIFILKKDANISSKV